MNTTITNKQITILLGILVAIVILFGFWARSAQSVLSFYHQSATSSKVTMSTLSHVITYTLDKVIF